jgi:Trypsin-like serine proteases, typically periplasmic, contain C-terminal PDZ domain
MDNTHNQYYELIEKYCHDLMDDHEKTQFEVEIAKNPALNKALHDFTLLLQSFDHIQQKQFIHQSLKSIHDKNRKQTNQVLHIVRLNIYKYWKTASVAASVAVIASMITFSVARNFYKKQTNAHYQTLRREINTIKSDQQAIKKEVATVKNASSLVPDYPSKYAGTGFAISKNGYLVTNQHVINGFTKIFVFTADNIGHQAEVVLSDTLNDLAVLKITETGFKFDGPIPYSVKKSNISIAQKVFSLGFPKKDIVYSEGYISSNTGFEGDSVRYQLQLPSGPGVSGAPVIDENGNVLGIISGKQSMSDGTTYAVKSSALLELFKLLPKDFSANEINNT